MRNLMGRLTARSDEELQRIAVAWQLAGTPRDRAGTIAQLMRSMTDLRAVRDFWVRRSIDEQELIVWFLANGSEQGTTIAELITEFGQDEERTRAIATRLYQAGVLASTARQQPLLVGEIPRLFLPRELGQLFARIQDELDAGDISQATPVMLLELLDDADIQRAAERWGLESMPGLRTRRELTEGLLELTGYPDRRSIVERKLSWDARRILALITELPAGQTIPLTEIAETLEFDPAQPRTAERLRVALGELEESLLVWHLWLSDGNRALFQPIWRREEPQPLLDRQRPPDPVDSEPNERPILHPAALAWDLLTLLRWLGAGTPSVAALSSATKRTRHQLDASLWNRGGEEPQPGYLEFLTALAEDENLLEPPDTETRIQPALRAWRNRSFDEQTMQLIARWLGAPTWIEAQDQEEVVVTGAHWPQFRRRLLVLLAELETDGWYRLDDLTRWLSRRSSDALGNTVQIATARPIDTTLDRSTERLSSLGQVVERTLRGGFVWFGLVEFAHIPALGSVVQITPAGRVAAGVAERKPALAPIEPPLVVHHDLTITLQAPSPVRIWSLTAFADRLRLRPDAMYRITSKSLERALAAGFRIEDVVTFLERQAGEPLESTVRAQLQSWTETMGRVWLTPAMVIQAEREDETRFLRTPLESAGLRITSQPDGLLVQGTMGIDATELTARVETILRELGKTPQFRADHESFVSEEPTGESSDTIA